MTELVVVSATRDYVPNGKEPDGYPNSGDGGGEHNYSDLAFDIVVDISPLGDVRDIIEAGERGNYAMMALSTGSLVLSFTPAGWGVKAIKVAFKFLRRPKKIDKFIRRFRKVSKISDVRKKTPS
ncbi:hypothetical protein J4E05_16615 [Thalassospira sp. NFXS8]|uniref:hypothetical protein n=1 Tax=Thalassospira sp. NFXS8 TaxID=2819093 RepID=UPI0032DE6E50